MQSPLSLPLLLLIIGIGGSPGTTGSGKTVGATPAAPPATSASPACLTKIRLVEDGNRSRLEFDISRASAPVVRRVEFTNLLVCEFGDCLPDPALANQSFSNRHVRAIHFSRQNQNLIVQVELATPSVGSVAATESAPPRLVVSLTDGENPASAAATAPLETAPGALASASATPDDAALSAPTSLAAEKPSPASKTTKPDKKKSAASAAKKGKAARSASSGAKAAKSDEPRNESGESAEDLLAGLPAPKGKSTFVSLGEKAIAAGEVDRGLAYLEASAATQKSPDLKRDLLIRVARRAHEEGLFAQSIRCYRRILANGLPDSLKVPVRVEMGRVYFAKGNTDRALAAWDSALSAAGDGPGAAVAHRARADAFLSVGRNGDALEDLRYLARRGRDEAEQVYAGYRLGVELLRSGRSDEASAALEQVPSLPSAEWDSTTAYFARAALVRRGDLLFQSGTPEAAIPIYERVVKGWGGSPEAAWAQFQTGNALRRSGKYADAEVRYQELIARWPDSRWAGLARWGAGESAALARTFGPGERSARTAAAEPSTGAAVETKGSGTDE